MNTRLLGAAVLIALAVLIVPMFFSSAPPAGDNGQVSLAIPPAPDRDMKTQTMDLAPQPPAVAGSTMVTAPAPSATQPSDRLATVDIASRKPRDVGTAEVAPAPAEPPAAAPDPEPTPAKAPAATPSKPAPAHDGAAAPPAATGDPGVAANGHYSLNLSAYANTASAQTLIKRVRALGYPAAGRTIRQGGQALTLVTAGPFATRTAAEAARLKITQRIPGAPARLESDAEDQHGDAPAPATATHVAGGYAVQVAAMASQADAQALRNKLRGAGFDGFVDTVRSGGRQLWRVRAGPQTRRADAERVRDQIKARLGLAGNVVSVP